MCVNERLFIRDWFGSDISIADIRMLYSLSVCLVCAS